ncbi:AAA family ATPase [Liquorilactobacillus nagelii]|uniref:AAA family ATPase n=1 Tax=Liquorilactobacillus nagelii TaxID=82688 RepID=UPI0006EFD792|nr:AAA family ATPase [Liquorilactobacillus nagelii]KRL40748.1 hypothetical protein FD45_GL001393 [Liquorilactobacillus nagelii DSM 13675]QYH53712.1 ATP-binding protein [Liquorilactobacillus nagelii DSM 13675]
MNEFKPKNKLGLSDNKKMIIKRIYGIDIQYFRKFKNQRINLGKNVTVIFGRNGTLKSTVMGLIAQPFRTKKEDIFKKKMQTKFSDVFKLSTKTDKNTYSYDIRMTINNNLHLKEPIPLYPEKKPGTDEISRFRLVPSGRAQGDGYFNLPSVFTKLDRLYPLVNTMLANTTQEDIYTKQEIKFIGDFYKSVLLRPDFSSIDSFDATSKSFIKHTLGPSNSYYDINTISSGEDNMSSFVNTMISFQRIARKDQLTGIWSIDEIESSLHPVAQVNLFDYLINWSNKYNVQIVFNTHSLYLIQHAISQKKFIEKGYLKINEITSEYMKDDELGVIENPNYSEAYSELTLSPHTKDDISTQTNVNIFCEDKVAKKFLSALLHNRKIMRHVKWQFDVNPEERTGTSYVLLHKLCINYPSILEKVNGIVIADADAADADKKIKSSFIRHYTIPSIKGYPLEKELVYWILSLSGDDTFFKDIRKSKNVFKNDFNSFNLPIDIKGVNNDTSGIGKYKAWYENNLQESNKIRTRYIRKNKNIFENFIKTIYKDISELMKKNGIIIDK